MIIKYHHAEDFYTGIQALIMKGLTFEANYTELTIKLLGGF
tara:strand:+ start:1236 stop:1358 length:123 start_codon:yes stop_codon:yes gene_type:complete